MGETPVRFSRWHVFGFHAWLVPYVLVGLVVLLTWPPTPGIWVFVVAMLALGWFVLPPPAFWAGGAPDSLDGTVLTVRRWHLGLRRHDLSLARGIALGGGRARNAGRILLIAHPDGHRIAEGRTLRRLHLPEDEVAPLLARGDRFVVLPLTAGRVAEVLEPLVESVRERDVTVAGSVRLAMADAVREQSLPRWRRI